MSVSDPDTPQQTSDTGAWGRGRSQPAATGRGGNGEQSRHDFGGLFNRVTLSSGSSQNEGLFDVVRRGYDCPQVEERVQQLTASVAAERARVQQTEGELRDALARLREAEQAAPATEVEGGFGARVEKLLRLAEHEASEIRSKASKEATALLEQARADAESHRHEVEEALISRAASMDHDAARRTAALNEREQEITDNLAAAREEADTIRLAAERDAEQERARAERRAQELTAQAEKAAQQERQTAEQEVSRLAKVRDGVRAEMAKSHRILGAELGLDGPPEPAHSISDGDTTRAAAPA